jgi:hypothetical protein
MRRWLASPASIAALFFAATILAPFVAWNAEHGFATFYKQLGRTPPHGFEPFYLLEFVGSQILLMNPLVFAPFAGAVAAAHWRLPVAAGSAEEGRRILVSTIAPVAIYFSVHALHDRVQGNWLAPLFPACAVLAGDWVMRVRSSGARDWKGAVAKASLWAAPLGLALVILGFVQAETGFLRLGAADPTARIGGFRDLARELDARVKAEGARYVLTQGYALASLMRAYGDPSIAVVQPEQRIRWIFEPSPPESLFASPGIALAESGRRYDLVLRMRYRTVEPLGMIERRRAGRPIEAYDLYRVSDPYAPVLDPPCPSAEVDLFRLCRP